MIQEESCTQETPTQQTGHKSIWSMSDGKRNRMAACCGQHTTNGSPNIHIRRITVLRNEQRVKQTFRVSCATLNKTVSEAPGSGRRRPCGAVFFDIFDFLSFFVDFMLTSCLLRTTKPIGLSSVTCSKTSELLTYWLVGHVQNPLVSHAGNERSQSQAIRKCKPPKTSMDGDRRINDMYDRM